MFWLLSKILVPLSSPLFWILFLAFVLFLCRKKPIRNTLIGALIVSILFFTNAGIISLLLSAWEVKPVRIDRKDVFYSYGIILGGFAGYNKFDDMIEFNGSSDRINYAILLYKQGKIGKFVISGGEGSIIKTGVSEADVSMNYLLSIGVPAEDIITENKSRNTIENVKFLQSTLKVTSKDCLLITSSYHMRRSLAIFRKHGLSPAYFCCDMKGSDTRIVRFFTFAPEALLLWDTYIHEIFGYAMYKIMGYC